MAKRALHASDTQTAKHITQSAIHAHNGANIFLPRNMFTAGSDGVGDAGKGVLLNSSGLIDSSMISEVETLTNAGGGVAATLGITRYMVNSSYMTTYRHKEEVSVSATVASNKWDFSLCDGTSTGFISILRLRSTGIEITGIIVMTGNSPAIEPDTDAKTLSLKSSSTGLAGATVTLYSAGTASLKGNMYLDFGDYTATAPAAASLHIRSLDNGAATSKIVVDAQGVHMALRSGANQTAAGAAAGELWHDTDDNTVKMGV